MNIILDPGLLWFGKMDECENFIYLEKVIDFIDTYLDIQYLPIDQFLILLIFISNFGLFA